MYSKHPWVWVTWTISIVTHESLDVRGWNIIINFDFVDRGHQSAHMLVMEYKRLLILVLSISFKETREQRAPECQA